MFELLKNNKKKIVVGSLIIAGFSIGLYLGKRKGERDLIEFLIHKYESNERAWPVYTSNDKSLGDLMYEIKAECIGD